MARALPRLRNGSGTDIICAWVKATNARDAARSTRVATARSGRAARTRRRRNGPEALPRPWRTARRPRGGAGRLRRAWPQGAAFLGHARRLADGGSIPRVACARAPGGRAGAAFPVGKSSGMAARWRNRALFRKSLCAGAGCAPGTWRAHAARRAPVHSRLDRVRDRRHLRQNAGVNTTISVKSSRRPRSMAKLQIHVCVSVRLA